MLAKQGDLGGAKKLIGKDLTTLLTDLGFTEITDAVLTNLL
jgi:uncharacterized protein (DUF1697 family)